MKIQLQTDLENYLLKNPYNFNGEKILTKILFHTETIRILLGYRIDHYDFQLDLFIWTTCSVFFFMSYIYASINTDEGKIIHARQ